MIRTTSITRTLATLCVMQLSLLAGSAWANDKLRFSDDFSQPGAWVHENTKDKTAGANGALRVERPGGDSTSRYTQLVVVSPAAAWRASVDVRLLQFDAKDGRGRAGLAIIGALGSVLEVHLDHQGDVLVGYHDGKSWTQPNPVPFTKAAAARRELGAVNTLSIERDAGFFRIFVNGVFVARTRIIDLTPRQVGISVDSAKPLVAELDNLKLEEIGQDSRYARLLNIVGTPGATELLVDNFDTDKNWWPSKDNDEVTVGVKGGRYVLTIKSEGAEYFISGQTNVREITRWGFPTGFQVSARTTWLGGDETWGRGINIFGPKPEGKSRPYFSLQVADGHLRVVSQKSDGTEEVLLPWTKSPSVRADGDNWLNMSALADGRVLLFVNFDYQTTVRLPEWYDPRKLDGVGIHGIGPQTVAFDNFYAREF